MISLQNLMLGKWPIRSALIGALMDHACCFSMFVQFDSSVFIGISAKCSRPITRMSHVQNNEFHIWPICTDVLFYVINIPRDSCIRDSCVVNADALRPSDKNLKVSILLSFQKLC